jgi:branched-chain amino acid aminotransferase
VLAKPLDSPGINSRVLIGLAPFESNPEWIYREGVAVGLARQLKREQPLAKKADFVPQRRKVLDLASGYYEYLLLGDDDRILEGTTSNFYVVCDGMLWTAGQGVLEGVARKVVLLVAGELGIRVNFEAVSLGDIGRLDEAALSSSSRALVPVISIAGQQVGDGQPGPLTARLLDAYRAYEASHVTTAI